MPPRPRPRSTSLPEVSLTDAPAAHLHSAPHLDDAWRRGLARIADLRPRRIVVVGPTDVGKSSFIRALAGVAERDLIDLDPGQKMIGPPGMAVRGPVAGAGAAGTERWCWIGSTSASAIGAIVRAAGMLGEADGFVANTSGYVFGAGARLQAATVAALRAELVVAIGLDPPPLPTAWSGEVLRLPRSPLARRKSPAMRARLRQQALETHLGAGTLRLPSAGLSFEPAPPAALLTEARPVCALADGDGQDMAIAVLNAADADEVVLHGAPLPRPAARVRLGRMWAAPSDVGWRLLERQVPAWSND